MVGMTSSSEQNLGASLGRQEYLRERLEPRPGDLFYLILSDLLLALSQAIKTYGPSKRQILDFGCGGSPYRKLFGNSCRYARADLAGTPELDFEMDPNTGAIKAKDSEFDLLLSSQVLEHVESPSAYLKEAYRLLDGQGVLILSTHGTFQDHPCPKDYWRWTGAGLSRELEKAGFSTLQTLYCTTGLRAAWAILEMNTPRLGSGRRWTKLVFELIEKAWKTLRLDVLLHILLDRFGEHYRVVKDLPPFRGVYVTLLIVATPIKK